MIADIAPGASVRGRRRVGGGLATDTFAFDLIGPGTRRLVVKRYREGDTTAAREWERLCFAQRVKLPVPEPVALDERGEWFGSPALVMTRLPRTRRRDARQRRRLAPATRPRARGDPRHRYHRRGGRAPRDSLRGLAGGHDAPAPAEPLGRTITRSNRSASPADRLEAGVHARRPASGQRDLGQGDAQRGGRLERDPDRLAVVRGRLLPRRRCAAARRRCGRPAHTPLRNGLGPRTGGPASVRPDLRTPRPRSRRARWLNVYREQGRTDTTRQFSSRATAYLRHALANLGG